MSENKANNSKPNPARRGRGGRGGRTRGGRKNYASEGDALTEMPTPAGSYPATPMKIYTGSPSASQPALVKPTTRKRNSTKLRPSNVSISLDAVGPAQRTPPSSEPASFKLGLAGSASAGPSNHFASSSSFHAPAPSTLPRPAFPGFATKSETSLRPRSESVSVPQLKEESPFASDSEAPSPSHHTGKQAQQEPQFSIEQWFDAERIRRANSANAAAPFSAPSRSQPFQLNDRPIPFPLPQRPAQRGVSGDTEGSTSAVRSDGLGRSIRHSLPPDTPSQPPTQQHHSPQPPQADAIRHNMQPYSQNERVSAAQPQMRYFSPQHAQAQAARHHSQHMSPHHTPIHGAQHHQLATPPQLDSSEQLKKLLWGPPSPSPQGEPIPASERATNFSTPTSSSAPPSGPHMGGGYSSPSTGLSNNGGLDTRKSLAEDALRKVLGLNFPLSMSGSGLDGNRSPQSRFPGHT